MSEKKHFRVFATSRIGDPAENFLRSRGYDVEVYQGPEAPPKKLIVDKVKSGIDGLITTLRDPIDSEVFEGGKGTLKVVAQIAVGFDNIDRAAANKYKIPFTNTADVLTEATAEFAFFMMGMLARKMWQSERLVREQRWPSWHPFLPILGDEVTGKTIAVIGTGRIGLAMIKKCSGFDMNILCYDPAYHNNEFVAAIQEVMDLRQARGIQKERTWIKYVEFEEALRDADYVTIHVPLSRVPSFRQWRTDHALVCRSRQRHGGPDCAGTDRRAGRQLRRRPDQDAIHCEQGSVCQVGGNVQRHGSKIQ